MPDLSNYRDAMTGRLVERMHEIADGREYIRVEWLLLALEIIEFQRSGGKLAYGRRRTRKRHA